MKITPINTRLTQRLQVTACALLLAMPVANAAGLAAPIELRAEVVDSDVILRWSPGDATAPDDGSENAMAAAGYNVYRDDRYVTTVMRPRWTGSFEDAASADFYVIAFDNPPPGTERTFSSRSATLSAAPDTDRPDDPPPAPAPGADPVPTAPTALVATRASNTEAEISWTASTDDVGVDGYNVYRDDRYITTVATSPMMDSGLVAGDTYDYYVVAFDTPRNFSAKSAPVTVAAMPPTPTTDPTNGPGDQTNPQDPGTPADPPSTPAADTRAPDAVSRLVAADVTDSSILLRWEVAEDDVGVEGYNVYRDGRYLTTVPGAIFSDTDLPAGAVSVSYSITAFDAARNFARPSATIDVRPMTNMTPSSALAAPDNLSTRLVANDWVEFRWDPVADAVAYNIYRDDELLYTIDDEKTSNEDKKYWQTTSYIDCNFTRYLRCAEQAPTPGMTYAYTVRAVDGDGAETEASTPLVVTLNKNEQLDVQGTLQQGNFALAFADEFDGESLNHDRWNTRLPWGPDAVINGELQYFVDTKNEPGFGYDPFVFDGETLNITGDITPPALLERANDQAFLSGVITSRDAFNFTYGYVESRIKVASGVGKLSSFFLFHQWAALNAAETDILEALGEFPEVAYQTAHYLDERDGVTTHSTPTMFEKRPGVPFDDDFHTYSVLWEPELVVWLIDDEEILRLSGPEVSRQRMYITYYLVMGSEWTPRPDPDDADFSSPLQIDWVRVWQRPEFLR